MNAFILRLKRFHYTLCDLMDSCSITSKYETCSEKQTFKHLFTHNIIRVFLRYLRINISFAVKKLSWTSTLSAEDLKKQLNKSGYVLVFVVHC